jgi:hypothetical protein
MINLTRLGGMMKIEVPGKDDAYTLITAVRILRNPSTGRTLLVIGADFIDMSSVTELSIGGVAVTGLADFETKLTDLFPNPAGVFA